MDSSEKVSTDKTVQEELMEALVHVGQPVVVVNSSGRILARNRLADEMFPVDDFVSLFEDSGRVESHLKRGFESVLDAPLRLKNGRIVLLSVASSVHQGKPIHTVSFLDVTHYHFLVAESQLSQRLSEVGNLAAGVAYEISNPLTVLMGRLEFLGVLDELKPEMLAKHLGVMQDHAARIAETVKNLQIFAHPALGVRESLGLLELLQQSASMSQARLGRVQVALVVEPDSISTTGDPGLLEQVFTSLFVSVAEAAGRRGRIVVAAKPIESHVEIQIGRERFSASDEAVSWSTVVPGQHTLGFGATLASSIVREHGGRMYFSRSDRGLRYRLELPLGTSEQASRSGETLKVLFVDDDAALCALGQDMIESIGHSCAVAESAEQALGMLESGDAYDLVVADVRLPGLSGLALQEVVAKRWPELAERFVLVTGLSIRPPDGVRLLQKPFTQSQLLAVLEEAQLAT